MVHCVILTENSPAGGIHHAEGLPFTVRKAEPLSSVPIQFKGGLSGVIVFSPDSVSTGWFERPQREDVSECNPAPRS